MVIFVFVIFLRIFIVLRFFRHVVLVKNVLMVLVVVLLYLLVVFLFLLVQNSKSLIIDCNYFLFFIANILNILGEKPPHQIDSIVFNTKDCHTNYFILSIIYSLFSVFSYNIMLYFYFNHAFFILINFSIA
jgi:hypothetical protein